MRQMMVHLKKITTIDPIIKFHVYVSSLHTRIPFQSSFTFNMFSFPPPYSVSRSQFHSLCYPASCTMCMDYRQETSCKNSFPPSATRNALYSERLLLCPVVSLAKLLAKYFLPLFQSLIHDLWKLCPTEGKGLKSAAAAYVRVPLPFPPNPSSCVCCFVN